jgi:hypothetical protein
MKEMPDVITPVSVDEVFFALMGAMSEYIDTMPTDNLTLDDIISRKTRVCCVLLAHWAFETGQGHAIHCYNIGNIKSQPNSTTHNWTFFACNEVINQKVVWFYPPALGCCFRAYENLHEGIADYINVLKSNFKKAWDWVLSANVRFFIKELKAAHYFTADVTTYSAGVISLYDQFLFKFHSHAEDIFWLAQKFQQLGYELGAIDNHMTPEFKAVIQHFQKDHGLMADGIIGPKTFAALEDAISRLSEQT